MVELDEWYKDISQRWSRRLDAHFMIGLVEILDGKYLDIIHHFEG
jgi:hypothetical protein